MTRTPRLAATICLATFLFTTVVVCGITIRPARAKPPASETNAVADDPEVLANEAVPIRIRVWWGIGGPLGDAFINQVNRFNQSQHRVVVETELRGGYEGIYKELKNAVQTDDLPDAAIVEIHSIASLAAAKKIQPLDDLIKDDRKFRTNDLLPGILVNLRFDDKLFALPINRSTPILYYNKDRFVEAGLNPDKPPETWQEVQEISYALTSADQSQYGFLAASFPWVFESLVWSSGGKLTDGNRATFAEPGSKTLQLWADMVHRDKTAQFGGRYSANSEFPRSRVAMAIESTAMLQAYTSASKFKVGTAPLPRFEGFANAVPTGGGGAVIPAGISAERKAAAWTFLTWFISTQQAAEWSRATGYIPVRESAQTLLRTEGFYDDHPEFETAIEQMKFAREVPQVPQWLAAWPIMEKSMTSIMRDDAPALETLKGAEKKVGELLNSKSE